MNPKSIRALAALMLSIVYCTTPATAQKSVLLPLPAETKHLGRESYFQQHSPLTPVFDTSTEIAQALTEYLQTTALAYGIGNSSATTSYLRFCLTSEHVPISEEGYNLVVLPAGITIHSRGAAGLFYGLQTFLQLKEQYSDRIPAQQITDTPRFPYRGMHLDVSRHFFDKEFVKKQLRMMASLKLNRLHWHLTDGAGWRIAIDCYPLLTEMAAWRKGQNWNCREFCRQDDPQAYGGFYTKEDIREIVAYAASLHIIIIPEIEMPSHSEEVTAVYPELGCPSQQHAPSELCLGNKAVYVFVEGVLTEVMELFPSEYIHIGGDEASPSVWGACPVCRAHMARQHIETPEELQGYFVRHVARFLHSHNRKMIGWDEILDDKLPPEAVIMSWRGEEGGRRALQMGHSVIMTPNGACYLDSYQDNPLREPQAMSGYVTLEDVYLYDPAQPEMPGRERVLGVQSNLWTEYISTPEHAEYMLYPRVFAIAERAWSNPTQPDYADFRRRALRKIESARARGYSTFNLKNESGDRHESLAPDKHLAVGCPIIYARSYAPNYAASGDMALIDGIHGSWGYGTRWQGFLDSDVDVTIDLGDVRKIGEVSASFIEWDSSWIWLPTRVAIAISDDGKTFRTLIVLDNSEPIAEHQPQYRSFGWQGRDKARYVRYHAVSGGRPGGWLFTDEIIVR